MRPIFLIFPIALLLLGTFPALAHDSPEHKVAELSSEMARSGESASLFMQRAVEHRALGELAHAAADFEAAFKLDPKLSPALKELSLVQLAQGQPDLALQTINRALTNEPAPDLLIARAEIHAAQKNFRAALKDCQSAFRDSNANLEWYLFRAQLQRRLGLFDDCLRDLGEGHAKTGSAVLHEETIDAMIDAGQYPAALKQIEPELADSRWRSSWLIRRARVRLALGQTKPAHRDLRAALSELNQRITPAAPDVSLLLDRALTHTLLGQKPLAAEDLALARTLTSDPWTLWRAEHLVALR